MVPLAACSMSPLRMYERGATDAAKGVAAMNTSPAASLPNSVSLSRKYPARGIREDRIRPMKTALRTDLQWATGLRLENVYLDSERVIITARNRTVRFDRTSASRVCEGNTPATFVSRAMISARDIMKALLFSRSLGVIEDLERARIFNRFGLTN